MGKKRVRKLPKKKLTGRYQAMVLDAKLALRWQKQVEGTLSFLEELKKTNIPEADKWASGTRDYYLKRMQLLLSAFPMGMRREMLAYKRRLEKLL